MASHRACIPSTLWSLQIYTFRTEDARLLFPHIRPANTSPHLVTAANMSASRCQSCDHKGQYQFSLYFTNVYFPNIAIQYIVSQCSGPANLISSVCTSEVSKSQIFFITVVLRVWMQIGSRQVTMGYVALSQVPQQPTLWLSSQLENLAIAIDAVSTSATRWRHLYIYTRYNLNCFILQLYTLWQGCVIVWCLWLANCQSCI